MPGVIQPCILGEFCVAKKRNGEKRKWCGDVHCRPFHACYCATSEMIEWVFWGSASRYEPVRVRGCILRTDGGSIFCCIVDLHRMMCRFGNDLFLSSSTGTVYDSVCADTHTYVCMCPLTHVVLSDCGVGTSNTVLQNSTLHVHGACVWPWQADSFMQSSRKNNINAYSGNIFAIASPDGNRSDSLSSTPSLTLSLSLLLDQK